MICGSIAPSSISRNSLQVAFSWGHRPDVLIVTRIRYGIRIAEARVDSAALRRRHLGFLDKPPMRRSVVIPLPQLTRTPPNPYNR